jgi:hypothetical protein
LIFRAGLPRERAQSRDHNNCQKSGDDFAHSFVSLPQLRCRVRSFEL